MLEGQLKGCFVSFSYFFFHMIQMHIEGRGSILTHSFVVLLNLLFTLIGWLQDLEGAHQGVVDGHHGASIIELSTVVGCGE